MRRLSSQIFVAQLAILTTTIAVGFALFVGVERGHLDTQYETRAAEIAQTTADVPEIRRCMQLPSAGCAAIIEDTASRIARDTGASYVVVIDMNRVRHSHPNPALIGQRISEPIVVTDGKVHVGTDNGSTGRSANGRAPLYGPTGALAGEVSVGLRESSVSRALWDELPSYGVWFGIALALGAIASWALARRLKRRTFGLELDEIALLLQEREATLHGIREGVIAFDTRGRVSMVNDEAQRLLRIGTHAVGRTPGELLPPGRLRDVLDGVDGAPDDLVLTDDSALVVNRMPVTLAGRPHGAVVTVRDRTELAALLRELDGERGLTDSLRAQQHEFANRMHAVAGLLELDRHQEALTYLTEIRGTAADFDNTLRRHIAAPQIVGLLLGKAAEASERAIQLEISPESCLRECPEKVQVLITVVGNLVDNAMEALTNPSATQKGGGGDRRGARSDHRRGDRQRSRRACRTAATDLSRREHHEVRGHRTIARSGPRAGAAVGHSGARLDRGHHGAGRHRSPIPGRHPDQAHHVADCGHVGRSIGGDGDMTAQIPVLIVDDDYRVASIHAAYVERTEGFVVVGQAHTAARAEQLAAELLPELVLMDIYLPDGSGLAVARNLLDLPEPPDIIVVTAARELDAIRTSMQLGAVHSLVKPFGYQALAERLAAYRRLRNHLDGLEGAADQADVDRLFDLLRPVAGAPTRPSKGHSAPTLDLVREAVQLQRRRCVGSGDLRTGRGQPRDGAAVPELPGTAGGGDATAPLRHHRTPGAPVPRPLPVTGDRAACHAPTAAGRCGEGRSPVLTRGFDEHCVVSSFFGYRPQ